MSVAANFVIRDALQSTVDNDWYRFTTPSAPHFRALTMALDAHSLGYGYAFEVYTRVGSQYRRVNLSNGRLNIAPSTTYYVRVHSTRMGLDVPLSTQNYELTIGMDLIANQFTIWSTPGHTDHLGPFGWHPAIRPNSNNRRLTVRGWAVSRAPNGILHTVPAGVRIELTVQNSNFTNLAQRYAHGGALTDATGWFTISSAQVSAPRGQFSTPGPIHGTLYDHATFWVHVGNARSNVRDVYILQWD